MNLIALLPKQNRSLASSLSVPTRCGIAPSTFSGE